MANLSLNAYLNDRDPGADTLSRVDYPPVGSYVPPEDHTPNAKRVFQLKDPKTGQLLEKRSQMVWSFVSLFLDYVALLLFRWAQSENIDPKTVLLTSAYRTLGSESSAHEIGLAVDVSWRGIKCTTSKQDPKAASVYNGWDEVSQEVRKRIASLYIFFANQGFIVDQIGPGNGHIHIGFGYYASSLGVSASWPANVDNLKITTRCRGQVINEGAYIWYKEKIDGKWKVVAPQPEAKKYCTLENNLREINLDKSIVATATHTLTISSLKTKVASLQAEIDAHTKSKTTRSNTKYPTPYSSAYLDQLNSASSKSSSQTDSTSEAVAGATAYEQPNIPKISYDTLKKAAFSLFD